MKIAICQIKVKVKVHLYPLLENANWYPFYKDALERPLVWRSDAVASPKQKAPPWRCFFYSFVTSFAVSSIFSIKMP